MTPRRVAVSVRWSLLVSVVDLAVAGFEYTYKNINTSNQQTPHREAWGGDIDIARFALARFAASFPHSTPLFPAPPKSPSRRSIKVIKIPPKKLKVVACFGASAALWLWRMAITAPCMLHPSIYGRTRAGRFGRISPFYRIFTLAAPLEEKEHI